VYCPGSQAGVCLGGLLRKLRLQVCVDSRDWQALLGVIGGRAADVTVEAKGKEHALAPMGVEIV
jgi:hypothetical protein